MGWLTLALELDLVDLAGGWAGMWFAVYPRDWSIEEDPWLLV
jgi:hypothetical protein